MDDVPCRADMRQNFALAKDDVMLFNVGQLGVSHPGRTVCTWLNHAIQQHGIQGAPEKDVSGELDATVIGVNVCDGIYLCPAAKKLAASLSGLSFLVCKYAVSEEADSILLSPIDL